MNTETNQTISIKITGELIIQRSDLKHFFTQAQPPPVVPSPEPQRAITIETDEKLPRLAFSMSETAKILGVSYITVHRLIQRRLLKSSSSCRHKMIPKAEIERFLKETVNFSE
jgi:excisionase family DNA binding protein